MHAEWPFLSVPDSKQSGPKSMMGAATGTRGTAGAAGARTASAAVGTSATRTASTTVRSATTRCASTAAVRAPAAADAVSAAACIAAAMGLETAIAVAHRSDDRGVMASVRYLRWQHEALRAVIEDHGYARSLDRSAPAGNRILYLVDFKVRFTSRSQRHGGDPK